VSHLHREVQRDSATFTGASRRRTLEDDFLHLRRAARALPPSTQRTASDTFDLPQPFGPTIAVTVSNTAQWNPQKI
jgi:hypothetical protein